MTPNDIILRLDDLIYNVEHVTSDLEDLKDRVVRLAELVQESIRPQADAALAATQQEQSR